MADQEESTAVDPKSLWAIFNDVDTTQSILAPEFIQEITASFPGFSPAHVVPLHEGNVPSTNPALIWGEQAEGFVVTMTPSPMEMLITEEEQEQEPIIPQPTCRFFAIARSAADDEGAEPNEDWPYNQLMNFHACTNPKIIKMGSNRCQMVNQQSSCVVYEPSAVVTLKQATVDTHNHTETVHRVKLSKTRYNYGTPEFKVTMAESNDEGIFDDETATVMHVVDGKEHNTQAIIVAEALFESVISDLGTGHVVHNDVKPQVVFPSYLKEDIACP